MITLSWTYVNDERGEIMKNKMSKDCLPPLKTLSIISFMLFLCGAVLFPFEDGGIMTYIREYAGLLWHISMFFFINKLPTPEWGRKAGTYWILIDVLSGLLYLNNFYGIAVSLPSSLSSELIIYSAV